MTTKGQIKPSFTGEPYPNQHIQSIQFFFGMTMDKRQVELAKENKNKNIKLILIKIF